MPPTRLLIRLAGDAGFEPANAGARIQCLTTWRIPNLNPLYSISHKNQPPKSPLICYNYTMNIPKNKKTLILIAAAIILLLIPLLAPITSHPQPSPVATREDFIGKTFSEAKKLADEKGLRYDIDNGNGIYDWESEDTQVVNWITSVHDENDENRYDYSRYTSHDYKLYHNWRISLGTDLKTDQQKSDEESCRTKDGYTFTYRDGKVDCHKTSETLCKESGKIWKNYQCKTAEEINADEKAKTTPTPSATPTPSPSSTATGIFNNTLKFQVSSVERGFESKNGREAVKINFSVTNITNKKLTYYAYHNLRYSLSDDKYEHSGDSDYNDNSQISAGFLQPGETRTGYKKFWIKPGGYNFRFCYDPSAEGTEFCLDT